MGFILSSCSSPSEPLPQPACTVVSGKNVPAYAVQTIREAEIVKRYKIGRRLDPANPNIMHEAGEIYVVRRSPNWNLRPNTPVNDSAFVSHLQPVNIQLENMQKQQALLQDTNRVMQELGKQMLKSREELKALHEAGKNRKDLRPLIDKLDKLQQEIIKKLAGLELSKN
jgi:hypothetical protein